jgi:MFS family permease
VGRDGALRRVLRVPELRLLFGASFVSLIGSWSYSVAVTAFVFERTHSYTVVGIASLARYVPGLLFSAYGGVLAERFERVRVLICSNLGSTVCQLGLTIVAAVTAPIWLAIVLVALTATTEVVYSPATAALIPQLVDEDQLAAANALDSLIQNLVVAIGPALGALLVIAGSPEVAFAINAASFLVGAVLLARMGTRSRPTDVTEEGAAGPLRQMLVGLQTIASSRASRLLVALSLLATLTYGTDTVLFVAVSHQQLHGGAHGYGYLLAGLGLGGALMAPAIDRLAAAPRLAGIIVISMAAYCLPVAALVVIHSMGLAVVSEVVRGAGTLVVDVLAFTALQRAVAPELLARVFGVFFALVLAAIAVGAVITAPMIHALGLRTTLYVLGFVPTVLGFAAYPALHRLDRGNAERLAELQPRIDRLEGLGLFAEATRSVLERLAGAVVVEKIPAGTLIIRQGDPADALYVIISGSVEVTSTGDDGGARVLRRMEQGQYFGELGIIERIARTASVASLSPCELYRIAAGDFRDALTELPPSTAFIEQARTSLARTNPARSLTYEAREAS